MQGDFRHPHKDEALLPDKQLGAIPSDLLVHNKRTTVIKGVDYLDQDKYLKDSRSSEEAGSAAPEKPPEKDLPIYIHQPMQRFVLDNREFFIHPNMTANMSKPTFQYYWKVPYILELQNIEAHDTTTGSKVNKQVLVGRPHNTNDLYDSSWILSDDLKISDSAYSIFNRYVTKGKPEIEHLTDPKYCQFRVHFDKIRDMDKAFWIKMTYLQEKLDLSEKMEYDFALRMQGLLNCGLNAVWTSTDWGFDSSDRNHIMEQFLQKYIGRFLSQVSQKTDEMEPDKIVAEALQMHNRFSSRWTKEHKRGLSPSLDSSSEALVSNFCDGPLQFLVNAGLTRKEIARMLRRDPIISPQFSLCLNFFMVKMDQDRNGRNANYKSMFNANSSNLLQMKSLGVFLHSQYSYLQTIFQSRLDTSPKRMWDPLTIDWYYIVSQLHTPEVTYSGVKRYKTRDSRGAARQFFS